MTATQRILLNIVVIYGRALFALACGLLSGRWILMALGEVDYGLYGVTVGLMVFVSFFGMLLEGAMARYYAVAIGKEARGPEGLADCRALFNAAVSVCTVLPTVILALGYPIAVYAVRHWLTIPPDRLMACVWVLRWVCAAFWIGMVTAPWRLMFTAKQHIAELMVYNVAVTALNTLLLGWMALHPGDWLSVYALCGVLLNVASYLVVAVRARIIFPECRLQRSALWQVSRMWELCSYAGWQFWGLLGAVVRNQGMTLLVNRGYGPSVNAAFSLAHTVSVHASSLSISFLDAFQPAISSAYGAGDTAGMRTLAYRVCRVGSLLMLLFAVPLAAELPEILRLWLGYPPAYTAELCFCVLAVLVMDKLAVGCEFAVNAGGRVASYQVTYGVVMMLTLPLAALFVVLGWGVVSVGYAMMAVTALSVAVRVLYARRLVGFSVRHWLVRVFAPLVFVAVAGTAAAVLPHLWLSAGLLRIVVATLLAEGVLLPLAWMTVLDRSERQFVLDRIPFLRRGV